MTLTADLAPAAVPGPPAAPVPVVDLRDGALAGHEVAGEDVAAARAAAPPGAGALFLDADPEAIAGLAAGARPLVLRVRAAALAARPAPTLRALARLRSAGWRVALEGVGHDPCALALLPIAAPDVIRLDVAALEAMEPAEAARLAGAVAAEAEGRRATVHAIGLDTPALVAAARAYGAELGSGRALRPPLAPALARSRRLPLTCGAGDPDGPTPWQRVTNWRRPVDGSCAEAERAASLVIAQAGAHREEAAVLATFPSGLGAGAQTGPRLSELAARAAFSAVLEGGPELCGSGVRHGPVGDSPRLSWTVAVLAPGFAACFVARPAGPDRVAHATSYDRELVSGCALAVMARLDAVGV